MKRKRYQVAGPDREKLTSSVGIPDEKRQLDLPQFSSNAIMQKENPRNMTTKAGISAASPLPARQRSMVVPISADTFGSFS